MARMPDMKVEAAEKARSACPMVPCWMGFGLLAPGFVRERPALPVSDLAFELGGIGCRDSLLVREAPTSKEQGLKPSKGPAESGYCLAKYTLGLCVMISVGLYYYYRAPKSATSIGVLGGQCRSGWLASASRRQPQRG